MSDLSPPSPPIIVIAGPTASGKSALAVHLAEALSGVVINCDSMQIYKDLDVLSARPSPSELVRAPHKLYGILDGAEVGSAARWRDLAEDEIKRAWAADGLPILCGGTGLYLRALQEGLSDIPDPPEDLRAEARRQMDEMGNEAFFAELQSLDPIMAERLNPGDTQRVLRAYEVVKSTGRSLAAWQEAPPLAPPLPARWLTLALIPPREELYARCDARLEAMVKEGPALDEVRALLARKLDPTLPVMKALGVPELSAFLNGDMDLDQAIEKAQTHTRRYAKRQMTWLRNQLYADHRFEARYSESLAEQALEIVRGFDVDPLTLRQ